MIAAADSSYHHELSDGLVARWATPADVERIAHLVGLVWRQRPDDPPNPRLVDAGRRELDPSFIWTTVGDWAIVQDTRQAGSPAVACAALWRHTWEYEGVPFPIGRPESCATHPDYRRQGLMRALFEMLHAHSSMAGDLALAISGIPHYYRQFGYEYALDFNGKRIVYLSQIPPLPAGTAEPYMTRLAEVADVPRIVELYNQRRAASMVWAVAPDFFWRYHIEQGQDPTAIWEPSRVWMVVDPAGHSQGFLVVATRRYSERLDVYGWEFDTRLNAQAAVPSLLRALAEYGRGTIDIIHDTSFSQIAFHLGRTHPLHEAFGPELSPVYEPPYAWYVRVPDVPRFLRHITPVLQRRLAASVAAGYSGELVINFYRGGVRLLFEQGYLASAEPWQAVPFGPTADADCPQLVFLQLLFGYRSLAELRAIYPDVRANDKATTLLNALFPARPSWVYQL